MSDVYKLETMTSNLVITEEDQTWIIGKTVDYDALNLGRAIENNAPHHLTLAVAGKVSGGNPFYSEGSSSIVELTVKKDGVLSGVGSGVYLNGDYSTISNAGLIESTQAGGAVFSYGTNIYIDNTGIMRTTGGAAIEIYGSFPVINNRAGASIVGTEGIWLHGATGAGGAILNEGLIKSIDSSTAIFCYNASDTIINHGRIVGSITLSGGDDMLDTRGGTISGTVLGGDGDDTLLTDNANITLQEGYDGGDDAVRSTVSYRLSNTSDVERLELIGRRDINAIGANSSEYLVGNAGDNVIKGMKGADEITGGRGDDILIGGEHPDDFVFKSGSGHDIIKDFLVGYPDYLHFIDWHGFSSWDDVMAHASFKGGDMRISAGGDSILLVGVTRDDVQNHGVFLFA